MDYFSASLAILGFLVLALGIGSKRLAKSPVPPTLIALVVGVIVGPQVLGWIDLSEIGDETLIRERLARLTIGIALMGVALRIPRDFPRRNWQPLSILVGGGMLLMWGISTVLVYWTLGTSFLVASLIGAIITPTDPIAATPIVTGELAEENIPERLRHTLSFESGANDGLSYLFLLLPFLILSHPLDVAISTWVLDTLLWQVIAATFIGLLLGYAAGKLLGWSDRRGLIEDDWRLIYTVALALLAVGLGRLIGSDEVLMVFASGVAFAQVARSEEREDEDRGQEAVNRFFSIPIFVLLGLTIPWEGWRDLGVSGVLLATSVLLLRRMPVLVLLKPLLSNIRSTREALFLGWFGPIAAAAIYYASMMEHRAELPIVWHAASLVVCASVLVHGMTGAPLTRLFGRTAGEQDHRA